MRKTVLALALAFSCTAALGADINSSYHLKSLDESERAGRSWKTLWLKPGKVKFYYYTWIKADGTLALKIETTPIKGVPDRRPLRESHPNLAIFVAGAPALGSLLASSFLATKL